LAINSFLVGKSAIFDSIIKFLAVYLIYALPIILLFLWFKYPKEREKTFLAVLGGVLAWLIITKLIVPHIWFRPRPDLMILGAKEILFYRPDYSFPSDHATMLFGLIFGLYFFGSKKAASWFLFYALLVVVARVAVGAHYPLDVLAGIVSGLIGATAVYFLRQPARRYIFKPFLAVAKFLHLA